MTTTALALLLVLLMAPAAVAQLVRPRYPTDAVVARPTAPPPTEQSPSLRCGGDGRDDLQQALETRKIGYRAWARERNAAGRDDSPSSILGYLSSNPALQAPWPAGEWRARLERQLAPVVNHDNDSDMGLNVWLRILYLHRANPALPPEAREQIGRAVTQYKYWIDEVIPNDARKQVFWSENHQAMYATAELLAGQLFPDTPFRWTLRKGSDHRARARARLERWLDERLRYGFSEFNSPVYYEYEILPLLNLADFAEDPRIAARAAMVLDLVLFDLARFTHRGNFGAVAGRVYAEHKVSGWGQSVGDTVEMLFGTRGRFTQASSPSAHSLATTTRYCVPTALLAIGRDRPERLVDRSRASVAFGEPAGVGYTTDADGFFWWSKGGYFAGPMAKKSSEMIAKWKLEQHFEPDLAWLRNAIQGVQAGELFSVFFEGMALTRANLYTYRDAGAMLSSVQGFHPGQVSPQSSVWQAVIDNDLSVFGTYPAARDSHDGPNWWTGNAVNPLVVQQQSAAIAIYAPHPAGAQALLFGHRTHLWFPFASAQLDKLAKPYEGFGPAGPGKFDEVRIEAVHSSNDLDGSVWIFGRKATPDGEAYVGIYSAQPCTRVTSGTWAGKEIVCEGLRNVFVIQVGSQKTFGSFDTFVGGCRRARVYVSPAIRSPLRPGVDVAASFDSPDPVMAATPGGHRLSVNYSTREVSFGGRPLAIDQFPRFQNPYTDTPWGAPRYTITHAGLTLTHDQPGDRREGQGVKPRETTGRFDMTVWSERYLYAVKASGELLWFGHVIGEDRNPPGDTKGMVVARPTDVTAVVREQPRSGGGAAVTSRIGDMVKQGTASPAGGAPVRAKPVDAAIATAPTPRLIHQWDGPRVVGTGWQAFRAVIPGGLSAMYGLTTDGVLRWYRHDGGTDGTVRWKGPVDVATGWNAFARVVAGGDGVLYGLRADGTLQWYRHADVADASARPSWSGPRQVGTGWGNFVHVFSTGEGVIYAVAPDGRLLWYRHRGYLTGTTDWEGPKEIGTGWAQFTRLFSTGDGQIYAVKPGGELVWYQHDGFKDGTVRWRGPTRLGEGWGDFVHVVPRMIGTDKGPVVR